VESRLLEFPLADRGRRCAQAIGDFKFAAAVVAYGMFLRDSPHKGAGTQGGVLERLGDGLGVTPYANGGSFSNLSAAP